MKKIILLGLVFTIFSCSSTKVVDEPRALYKVLVSSDYGGAAFQFFEVISEKKEFNMLLGDDEIKKFVKPSDIETANFVLVNLGEKNSGGYKIDIKNVTELSDKIIVDIEEIKPDGMAIQAITNPYCVLKINSKKPIEFK